MTYPPANSGYPVPQQPGYGGPAPAYPAAPAGPSKLPEYLSAAVLALGLAAYLASFGPLLSINTDIGPFGGAEFTASGLSYWTVAALFAALLAGVSLLPKTKAYTPVVAVAAVLGVLLVIGQIVNRPNGFSVGWALWLVLVLTVLQAAAAVSALLFETGVLSAPAPRPRYGAGAGQFGQYGPPPGGYYPGGPGQRPGYPSQYGGYPGGPAQGGFSQPETDTPPTGFPSYSPSGTTAQHAAPAESAAEPAPGGAAGAPADSPKP